MQFSSGSVLVSLARNSDLEIIENLCNNEKN